MSPKFASITAGLLARKGEARPWNEAEKAPLAWRTDHPAPLDPTPPMPPATAAPKEKSCAVRMSQHDYERLGILSVKTGISRQQLLKDALAQFLAVRAHTLACACLTSENMGACENRCDPLRQAAS
jgi:hypothetical protein